MFQKSWILSKLHHLVKITLLLKLTTFYLEPGSSSFLLKILISSLVALVVFFRQIWSYVRTIFVKVTGRRLEPIEKNAAVAEQPPQNKIE